MYQATNVYVICGFAAIVSPPSRAPLPRPCPLDPSLEPFSPPSSPMAIPAAPLSNAPASSGIQCACNGIVMLIVGRSISGICIGITSAIVPVYQSEIAPKEIRGRIVTLQQWAITWGILIQYFIQYGASHVGGGAKDPEQPTAAFRIPWGLQMIPSIILFCGLFFLPRSPRWLASKDRWDEAIQVLADLHAGGDIDHPRVLAEYREIEEALRFERDEATSSIRALVAPRMIPRVLLGMSIQMWSQLCGMNVMMYYIVTSLTCS
ncbi:hypothetical protein V491_01247 [Pseudogymnoascus sp. VKM F-3775]|nr:hypothetical protein V491_01247 [Pseudogymnoascus sp. VKM F-3775]